MEKSVILEAAQNAAKKLGYPILNKKQKEVILTFLSGNDVFAVLPTGYGKSLYYTCLPIAFDNILKTKGSIAVVVTPLTAFIRSVPCIVYQYDIIIQYYI